MSYRFTQAYLLTRLPQQYLNYRKELQKPATPVHYVPEEGIWKRLRNGTIRRVENVMLPLIRVPKEDEGLWGGEAIVKGFKKKDAKKRRVPHYWVPHLMNSLVYSEILNTHMKVVVTNRTLHLIDSHYGFDSYILRTPVQDLRSQLGMDIRRKLLLALLRRDMWHDDPEKQERIYNKYKDCIIPEEEAEWFGLSLVEALRKQRKIEVELSKPVPYKIQYRKELVEQLKEWKIADAEKEESSMKWLPKLNFFAKKD